jgi:hypothetical protein
VYEQKKYLRWALCAILGLFWGPPSACIRILGFIGKGDATIIHGDGGVDGGVEDGQGQTPDGAPPEDAPSTPLADNQITPDSLGTSSPLATSAQPLYSAQYPVWGYYPVLFGGARYWFFWNDGTNCQFTSSTKGTSWAPFTPFKSCSNLQLATTADGANVHYVTSPHYGGAVDVPISYRRGLLNSDGTVSWSAQEQMAKTSEPAYGWCYPSISVDFAGHPWVGYNPYNSSGALYAPWVTTSSKNNGQWLTASGFPLTLTPTWMFWFVQTVPLASGESLLLAAAPLKELVAALWQGSALGPKVLVSGVTGVHLFYSAQSVNNDVFIVHRAYTVTDPPPASGPLYLVVRTYSNGSFSAPQKIVEKVGKAALATDGSGTLYLVYDDAEGSLYTWQRTGGSWAPSPKLCLDKSAGGVSLWVSNQRTVMGRVGIVYQLGQAAPYTFHFTLCP